MGFWSFWHNPKDRALQELFRQLAGLITLATQKLEDLLQSDTHEQRTILNHEIIELEHKGDALINQIRLTLAQIAITSWVKQSDALQLSRLLDSVLDGIRATSSMFIIYQIDVVRPEAKEFASIIQQIATEVNSLIEQLASQNYHTRIDSINATVDKIGKLENRGDSLRVKALRQVWLDQNNSSLSMGHAFQWDKIIEELEEITDRAHHVANSVLRITTY